MQVPCRSPTLSSADSEIVKLVPSSIGARCWVTAVPKWLAYIAGSALGLALRNIVLTKDEITGLSRHLLIFNS